MPESLFFFTTRLCTGPGRVSRDRALYGTRTGTRTGTRMATKAVPHRFCLVRMKRRKPSIPGLCRARTVAGCSAAVPRRFCPSCRAHLVVGWSATVPRRFCPDFARLVWSKVIIPHRFCPSPCFSAPAKLRGSVLWKVVVWSGAMIPHRLRSHFPVRSQSDTTIPRRCRLRCLSQSQSAAAADIDRRTYL